MGAGWDVVIAIIEGAQEGERAWGAVERASDPLASAEPAENRHPLDAHSPQSGST
jgi:hypothetical protein